MNEAFIWRNTGQEKKHAVLSTNLFKGQNDVLTEKELNVKQQLQV